MSCLISGFGIHQTKIIKCQQVKSVSIKPQILYTQPCGQARRQIVTNLKLLQTDVVCITEEECIGVCNPVLLLPRSEEHTSELQSRGHLVCRLLLEKKKTQHCPT